MSLSTPSNALTEEVQLAESIERRHTYRKPFSTREVNGSVLDQLIEAGKREGARLHPLLTEEAKQQAV